MINVFKNIWRKISYLGYWLIIFFQLFSKKVSFRNILPITDLLTFIIAFQCVHDYGIVFPLPVLWCVSCPAACVRPSNQRRSPACTSCSRACRPRRQTSPSWTSCASHGRSTAQPCLKSRWVEYDEKWCGNNGREGCCSWGLVLYLYWYFVLIVKRTCVLSSHTSAIQTLSKKTIVIPIQYIFRNPIYTF